MTDDYISYEKAKEGMDRSLTLANRLLEGAEHLLEKKDYTSSVCLSILSFEEVSKASAIRLKVKQGKGLTKSEWMELSHGKKAHDIKLVAVVSEREKNLERLTKNDEEYIKKVNQRFGIPTLSNLEYAKAETKMLKDVLPRLNALKQDCMYLNWSEDGERWSYFDMKFGKKIKKAIASFLVVITKRMIASKKFYEEIPSKPFQKYTKEEWDESTSAESLPELRNILKNTNTLYFVKISDMAIPAIKSYPKDVRKKK